MTYSRQRLKEVTALKREAVRRIQNDIGEMGASPSRKYIQEFNREFQNFEAVTDHAEILEEARQANLIWIGDYHALIRRPNYASEFLRDINLRKHTTTLS